MREKSHDLGKVYQRKVKAWLLGHTIFGLLAKEYGDAYDATSAGTMIGKKGFDFSFALGPKDNAKKILYCECKYRNEKTGNINDHLQNYLIDVYEAISTSNNDEKKRSEFIFVSNIPPDKWRQLVNNTSKFIEETLEIKSIAIQRDVIDIMITCSDIIILPERIIEVNHGA